MLPLNLGSVMIQSLFLSFSSLSWSHTILHTHFHSPTLRTHSITHSLRFPLLRSRFPAPVLFSLWLHLLLLSSLSLSLCRIVVNPWWKELHSFPISVSCPVLSCPVGSHLTASTETFVPNQLSVSIQCQCCLNNLQFPLTNHRVFPEWPEASHRLCFLFLAISRPRSS